MKKNKIKFFTKTKSLNNILLPILFILTFILIFFNKTDHFLIYKIKTIGINVINPISKVISSPTQTIQYFVESINEYRTIKKENVKLKEEIYRLKKWQTLAIKIDRENLAYKKLLNSTTNDMKLVKTAYVLSRTPNIYSKTININAGLNDEIKKNMPVINERGLVGKVVFTTENKSSILLINDKNSYIPVKVMGSENFAIINGTNQGKYLVSSFVKQEKKITIGSILVTSGNGNIFPQDILVGKVIDKKNDKLFVLPFVDLDNLEFVQILNNE
jgi:rod shape-determining protein MreC